MRIFFGAPFVFALFIFLAPSTIYSAVAQVGQGAVGKRTIVENSGDATLEEIDQRRAVLFQRMLDVPEDLDTAFEYAALSVRAGDVESAISTLERMLIFAPGLPRLQLELGLLYYRVGAFETARAYLEAAVAGPNVPDPVRLRVENLLSQIAEARDKDKFSAQLRAGIRYQTNANRSPDSTNILLNGIPFQLNPQATEDPDGNVYLAGTFHYAKDLASQGDTFEIDGIFYAANQFDIDTFDIVQGELTAGPAFDLGRFNIDDAKIGIYAIGSATFLGSEFYGYAAGAGARIAARVNPRTNVLVKGEYRYRFYENSTLFPVADNREGNEFRAAALVSRIITPNLLINGGIQGQILDADADFLSYREINIYAGPTFAIPSPINEEAGAWIASLSAGLTYRSFDEPDPVINVNESQSDREYFGKFSLTVPFSEGWAFLGEAEYRRINSNYDTREHDNLSATLSIVKNW